MVFQSKNLVCSDCHNDFIFSAGEQEFFENHGLQNEPKRCPHCRVITRMKRSGRPVSLSAQISCAQCGELTTVPFQPKGDRPVFCSACYLEQGFNRRKLYEQTQNKKVSNFS